MYIAKYLFCLGCLGLSGPVLAGNNNCAGAIALTDNSTATPYPSTINIGGAPTSITGVTVAINGFNHAFPDDVGLVLVGPGGQALLLQSGAGDASPVSGVNYLFDDASASVLPDLTAWTSGSYKPTAYYSGDIFPAPGPGTSYGNPGPAGGGTATLASTYAGTSANGTWRLYAVDFAAGDAGSITNWCLTFTGTPVSLQQFSVD